MFTWADQLLKMEFIISGICLILFAFIAGVKVGIPTKPISQAERIRRSLIVGIAVTLLMPGIFLIALGFSSEKITLKAVQGLILTSICFSPMGLPAALGTYSKLWGWTKLKDDILFLDDKEH